MTVVTPGPNPSPLPKSGHTGTSAGQISAPTKPPLTDPDLQTIVEVWPTLPTAIKKAMMALVAAAAAEKAERPEGASASGV